MQARNATKSLKNRGRKQNAITLERERAKNKDFKSLETWYGVLVWIRYLKL